MPVQTFEVLAQNGVFVAVLNEKRIKANFKVPRSF